MNAVSCGKLNRIYTEKRNANGTTNGYHHLNSGCFNDLTNFWTKTPVNINEMIMSNLNVIFRITRDFINMGAIHKIRLNIQIAHMAHGLI